MFSSSLSQAFEAATPAACKALLAQGINKRLVNPSLPTSVYGCKVGRMLLVNTEIHHRPCIDPCFLCRSKFNVVCKRRTAKKQYGATSKVTECS
jgi:hypothetical protein